MLAKWRGHFFPYTHLRVSISAQPGILLFFLWVSKTRIFFIFLWKCLHWGVFISVQPGIMSKTRIFGSFSECLKTPTSRDLLYFRWVSISTSRALVIFWWMSKTRIFGSFFECLYIQQAEISCTRTSGECLYPPSRDLAVLPASV